MQKVSYMGDGSTTEFNFNFPYFENSNIIVTKNNVAATGYSIIGTSAGQDADIPYTGGKVVFETAPTSLDNITISRSLPLNRVADYQPTELIEPTVLNQDANYLMEVIKDRKDEIDSLFSEYNDIANKESTITLLARISELGQQITALGNISTLRTNVTTNTNDITILKGYDYVIESQIPSSENNYTWYRKYKSGWVEQGGDFVNGGTTVTLPVAMRDTYYTVTSTHKTSDSTYNVQWGFIGIQKTTTSITIKVNGTAQSWFVCGVSEQS